ncbi:Mitochondrial glycoprotein family protein [Thalictrum thalictroides]|uniref:Mitochondrial glycoprotein family protein n=1 Tax=Thalictrum thalictroides TaxID=46969 RepID=A0A7J6V6V9_THATH|nr:Mitochondrial glycoprotein family protein [Thalictrum thalictroides]
MGFSNNLLRRVGPIAIRAIGIQRNYNSSPLKKLLCSSTTTSSSSSFHLKNFFSSGAALSKKPTISDHTLIQVIESEIKCSEESDDYNRVDKPPPAFPFEIEDNLGQRTLILKREYNGESIKVVVYMPSLITGDMDDDDDDDDEYEKANQSSIPLIVTVSKKKGPSLEFGVTAFADEVIIDSMSVKESIVSEDELPYEGPDFTSLDENLQKAFTKYLELRGIKPSTTNFLHEYMINKDSREFLYWLKNLKNFVEK